MLDYTYKPLDGTFPRPLTPVYSRQDSRFGKTWKQILEDLERELRFLNYRLGSCVIMTAHTPYDVRQDGKLRRDARKPDHPGVVIKFDVWDAKAERRYAENGGTNFAATPGPRGGDERGRFPANVIP